MTKKVPESVWLVVSFAVPFLLTGGYWAYLTWSHAINDAGRNGSELSAFDPQAVNPAFQALFVDGIGWGRLGLVICFAVLKTRKRRSG